MRAFVTGGTGFIGRRIVAHLLGHGHEVVCLVRPSSATEELTAQGALLAGGDITDMESILRGAAGCDCVVHCAALYSVWERDARRYTRVNEEGTANVMEAALTVGVGKAVLVSTALVYGEPADCPFTEKSPPGPVRYGAYVESKHRGERRAWRLHREDGLPLVVVYPGAVIGPGDPNVTGDYVRRLVEGTLPGRVFEDSVNTYVYVDDVAQGVVAALSREGNAGERYLLGRSRASYADYNRLIAELAGIRLPRVRFPNALLIPAAAAATAVANLTGKPPLMGLALDAMQIARHNVCFDGVKACRELGVTYTPLQKALVKTLEPLLTPHGPVPRAAS